MSEKFNRWYVQKGEKNNGPFTAEQIRKMVSVGRVRTTDRVRTADSVCNCCASWEKVHHVPQLLPECITKNIIVRLTNA